MEENCEYSHDVSPKDDWEGEACQYSHPAKDDDDELSGRKGDFGGDNYNPYDQSWRQYRDVGIQDERDSEGVGSAFLNTETPGRPDSRVTSAFLNTRRSVGERDRLSQFETPSGGNYWNEVQEPNERFGGPESHFPRHELQREESAGWTGYDQFTKPSPYNRFMPREPVPPRAPSLFLSSKAPAKRVCKQFKEGKCTFGAMCKFSHGDPADPGNNQETVQVDNSGVGSQNAGSGIDQQAQRGGTSKRKVDSIWEGKNGKRFKPDGSHQEAPMKKRVLKKSDEIGVRDKQLEQKVDRALKRVDLKLCIQLAIQACKKCGEVILKKKDDPERGQHTEDLEEECCNILATAIARKWPLHTILSRLNAEGITDISRAPTWCISSLDSIDNFVRGSSLVCISVGLCVEKRPVMGVIYNPIQGHLFAARRRGGTFVNKSEENKRLVLKPVRLQNPKPAKDAVISNEYSAGNYRNGLAELGTHFKETGSLSNNFLDVMRKMSDAGFQTSFEGPWSVCAGVALIEEAGGLVTDLEGNVFQLGMNKQDMVYGPRKLVEEMLHLI